MTAPAKARIGFKEYEALIWVLGNILDTKPDDITDVTHPLYVLLSEGFALDAILDTATGMFERLQADYLVEPLTDLDKALLRVCIENTSWVTAYIQLGALDGFDEAACRKILRKLAAALEPLGVEVNFIPKQ